jgi:hypothetical protein
MKWLSSSELLCCVVWLKFTGVSKVLAASIIRAMSDEDVGNKHF